MIQANELRLGNWVDYKGKYYQIYDGIRSFSIDDLDSEKLDSHFKNIKLSDLQPIPLTEEILLKCGFAYSSKLSDNDSMTYYLDDEFEILWLGHLCLDINSSFIPLADTELKHLHQLQNLYLSITGEELNIQL